MGRCVGDLGQTLGKDRKEGVDVAGNLRAPRFPQSSIHMAERRSPGSENLVKRVTMQPQGCSG